MELVPIAVCVWLCVGLAVVQGQQVYLSLGSTTITTNNTEVLITDIGEDGPGGGLPSLTCHTDLTTCCRNAENNMMGPLGGEWYYPNGTALLNNARSTDAGEDFYFVRNAPQLVRLARKISGSGVTNTLSPTGTFCCVISTTGGEMTLCANIVLCPSLPPPTNGMISYSDPTLGEGSMATYSCDTGYTLNGGSTRTCQLGGWSGSAPTCQAVSCGSPPSISNGFPGTLTSTTFGGTVTYSCGPGYKLLGPATITCQASGSWGTTPQCALTGRAVYLSLGSTTITTNNTEVLITDVGEDVSGGLPSLTCHTDLTTCCRNSDNNFMGSPGGLWYYPDGTALKNNPASMDAREGFYFVRNGPQLVRLARRVFAPKFMNTLNQTGTFCCVIPTTGGEMTFCANIVVCPSLLPPTNGMISYSDPTLGEGSVATYSCDTGYTLNGGSTRTCQLGGTWSGSAPTCQLPPVYVSLGPTNYAAMNSQIDIATIGESDEQALVCHTDSTTCCRAVDVNPLSSSGAGEWLFPDKGVGEWLFPNGTAVVARQDVTDSDRDLFFRSRGTQLVRLHRRGSVTMPTGSFCCMIPESSGEETTFCVDLAVFCGSPLSIANGSPGTPTSTLVGGTVTYSCDPGYIMPDSANNLVTCLSTGDWSSLPSCQTAPPVYLSLSSTNYLSGLSEIPLSSVGEGRGSSLVCHTDLATCCDSGVEMGAWHYPNGSAVSADSAGDGLYVSREQMSVSLNYRRGVSTVTAGLYCCVLPTSQGTQHYCIVIDSAQGPSSHPDSTGAVVGGVVAVVTVLSVCVTVTVCMVLRHKRGGAMSVSTDITLSDEGQSSTPIYEMVPGIYEETPFSAPRKVKGDYEYSQNEAYATTVMSGSGRGN